MNFQKNVLFALFITLAIFSYSSCKKDEIIPSKEQETTNTPDSEQSECPSGNAGDLVKGQYLVFFKENSYSTARVSLAEAKTFFREKSEKLLHRYGIKQEARHIFSAGFKGFAARIGADKIEQIKEDPEVAVVEADRIVALEPFSISTLPDSTGQMIPWGVKRIGYDKATEHTAWILDTGIDLNHEDLNVDQQRSVSFVCGEPSPQDANGHGSHVAGIIAAKNNNIGVVGVAAGNTVVAVKVMGADGKGTVSNLIAGLDYVYKNAKPGDVVNMSLSGEPSKTLDEMILKVARDKGVFFTLAAGNETKNADNFSPQHVNYTGVFTVSAMDKNDTFAPFSNFGSCIDYGEPGVKILSTYKDGQYAYLSGTSMAAPHLAGLLLLNGTKFNVSGTVKNDPDGNPDPIAILSLANCPK